MSGILARLDRVLQERRDAPPGESYVGDLYRRGENAILKKIGEEAAEVLIAAKEADRRALVHEVADLWFHTLVALAAKGLSSADVLSELDRRFGVSGLAEKRARGGSED